MSDRVAFLDGPFDPRDLPWLLTYQRSHGLAVQSWGEDWRGGYWTQPHGYLRGAGRAVIGAMGEPKAINNGGDEMGKSIRRRFAESEAR